MHRHRFTEHPFARGRGRGFGPGFGRGFGGRGRASDSPPVDRSEVAGWFAGRLPDGWFTGPVDLTIDRDEITVVGTLPEPAAGEGDAAAARAGRISRFREETREQRMAIADAAQERYGRSVAWGAACGDTREVFTNLSVPVMTRLRQPERLVLDTLVDAGVARSRSEALVWAVRLVGEHADDWLRDLREAMAAVEEVRARGPRGREDDQET
ncbi:hypothetical protein OF117_09080 [Geodermatophilus sp. YIM 151500]|uniref:hypothetical protein n=1 Tax=Geodermatophilus sp. YIM 151500 TaxID=2984531 RepID=UPI0021E3D269|nr:hypothetical protein [Geodermatophilus sp. YIM 151500]MCV2489521.1 hypothetical protein [Geodermatophilus sp. YIM 151500]